MKTLELRKGKYVWEYRTLCMTGEDAEKALNEAGRLGFKVLHVNHEFAGHEDRGGVCFVLLGRRVEAEPLQ
ncbi:MAG: hypothetical protein AB1758_33405 [Candidatus Eremiobacterota bacterium]